MIPVMVPTIRFAFPFLKNDICVQSWKIMKVRITNPAATIDRRMDRNMETDKAWYAKNQRIINGIMVFIICMILAFVFELAYGATLFLNCACFSLLIISS